MSLQYLVKYRCSENCHAQELSEASCHARLSHSNQLLKKSCTAMLALLFHWRKDVQSGRTKNPTLWLSIRTCHDTEEKISRQNVSSCDKWSVSHNTVKRQSWVQWSAKLHSEPVYFWL